MSTLLELQVQSLLERVRRQRDAECAAATWDAERQVATLLADAKRLARERVRAAAREKRERVAERCRKAAAAAETAGRAAAFVHERELLARAAESLPAALVARWRDPAARLAWARAALRLAARRLVGREWRIAAAPGFAPDERDALLGFARELGAHAVFDADAGEAGLVVRTPGASLDATPRGLLADAQAVAARVLAALRSGSAR